jgi:hypothetical protein
MFIKIKNYAIAKLQSITAFAVKWMKRFVLVAVVVGAFVVGTVYMTVQTILPHAHNIYSATKLIDGEARGESRQGQKAVFGSILVRMADARFPDTMHGVVYQPYSTTDAILQYNAMGDTVHENLSTQAGQRILVRTAWWYMQNELGIFASPKEVKGAHSYCRPDACIRQSGYFGDLKLIGQIGNHMFYGDLENAAEVTFEVNASSLTTSLRPMAREESVVFTEQDGEQTSEVDDLIAQVVAEAQ